MLKILTKLRGDGTPQNPFTVNFPTFSLESLDSVTRLAVITIPDINLPSGLSTTLFNAPWLVTDAVQVVRAVGLNGPSLEAFIRSTYREGFSDWDAREELSD